MPVTEHPAVPRSTDFGMLCWVRQLCWGKVLSHGETWRRGDVETCSLHHEVSHNENGLPHPAYSRLVDIVVHSGTSYYTVFSVLVSVLFELGLVEHFQGDWREGMPGIGRISRRQPQRQSFLQVLVTSCYILCHNLFG